MNTAEQVTAFVVRYTQPTGDNWELIRADWNGRALDAWLDAARQRGIDATVLGIGDSHDVVGFVDVDGRQFAVCHLGRRMELQAEVR